MHHSDPVKFPIKGLAPKYRGRCQPPKFVKPTPIRSIHQDPTMAYNPPGEPTALKTCQKIRQTRRLVSLFRQVNRSLLHHHSWQQIPPATRDNLQKEWGRIKEAQGYGSSWSSWILGFECVSCISSSVPPLSALHVLLQITKLNLLLGKENVTVGMHISI